MTVLSRPAVNDDDLAVLRARAAQLAQPPADRARRSSRSLLVVATPAGRFGLDAARVREVLAPAHVTRVPARPGSALVGLRHVRGELLALADLGRLLDLPARTAPSGQPVVVVGDSPDPLGLLVDSTEALLPVDDDWGRMAPRPVDMDSVVTQVSSGGMLLIDVDALLAHPAVSPDRPGRERAREPEDAR